MLSIAQLKPGVAIVVDGAPHLVTKFVFSKQARGAGVAKTTLKNLLTGGSIQKTFQGNDKIEPADLGYSKAQYLYASGEDHTFMDLNTYDQFNLSADDLGDAPKYLIEGNEVDIHNFEGRPIAVKLKPKVELKVVSTEPGVKGDTASGGTKPATLETGLVVTVPLFINEGDVLRINTETGDYVERA